MLYFQVHFEIRTSDRIKILVLCEIKEKSQLSQRSPSEDDPPDQQQPWALASIFFSYF